MRRFRSIFFCSALLTFGRIARNFFSALRIAVVMGWTVKATLAIRFSFRAVQQLEPGNTSPDRGIPTSRSALLRSDFGFCFGFSRERLPEGVRGGWPAKDFDDALAFLEALQIQLDLV